MEIWLTFGLLTGQNYRKSPPGGDDYGGFLTEGIIMGLAGGGAEQHETFRGVSCSSCFNRGDYKGRRVLWCEVWTGMGLVFGGVL